MKPFRQLAVVALVALLSACGSGGKEDPILRLSAAESLAKGKEFFAAEKYSRARPYFQHAFEVEPNSAIGRESLLLVADTLFMGSSTADRIQAEAKYRDYQNRFPTSNRSAYVQYQVANSLTKRMGRSDRDLSTSTKALEAFQDLLRLYPTSEYAEEAREQIHKVRENLAEHEYLVGRFYLRYGLPASSAARFESLLEKYPAYGERDAVLFYLGSTYSRLQRTDDAQAAFSRLSKEHPDSRWLREIPKASR